MRAGQIGRVLRVLAMGGVVLVGAGLARNMSVVKAQQNAQPVMPLSSSQQQSKSGGLPSDDTTGLPEDMNGPTRARMNEVQVKLLNEARHKRLEDDAAKLQALSNDLKTDVDKSNKDELSLEVMRKAEEIEKLAHDVQSRMKN